MNTLKTTIFGFSLILCHFSLFANDNCADAMELIPSTSCNYTTGTFNGMTMGEAYPFCEPSSSQDVWYKFTATDTTMSITITAESGLKHGFQLFQGGCGGASIRCINASMTGTTESYFNNNFIPGQEYYIRVFNASSTPSSKTFEICIRKYPTPNNDLCSTAIELTPGTSCNYVTGTFSGAMNNDETASCALGASQDVWYKFTATDSTMRITLSAVAGLNHGFELIRGGCDGVTINCTNSNGGNDIESYFNINFIPGQEYHIRVINAAVALNTGTFGICVTAYPAPSNNLCSNATELTPNNSCTYLPGTFSGAMMSGTVPSCGVNTSQDVWYSFTATSGNMTIQLGGVSGLNHGFQVFKSSCNGTEVICRNQFSSGTLESYAFTNLVPGERYFVRVFNSMAAISTSNFNICLIGPPPSTCTPSVSISTPTIPVCKGTNVIFNAVPIYGGTFPSYQWKINGNNVGTNSSSYSTAALTDGSIVSCIMTSNAGCASSTTTVSNEITININPINVNVTTLENTISAVATNASYRWINCSNNQPINGETNSSFTPSQNGYYAAIVTQNGCSDTSTCILINSVGIKGVSKENVQLYPNPFKQTFILNSTVQHIGMTYTITDVFGKIVEEGIISEEKQLFDLSELDSGVYFMRLDRQLIKFIKHN